MLDWLSNWLWKRLSSQTKLNSNGLLQRKKIQTREQNRRLPKDVLLTTSRQTKSFLPTYEKRRKKRVNYWSSTCRRCHGCGWKLFSVASRHALSRDWKKYRGPSCEERIE